MLAAHVYYDPKGLVTHAHDRLVRVTVEVRVGVMVRVEVRIRVMVSVRKNRS